MPRSLWASTSPVIPRVHWSLSANATHETTRGRKEKFKRKVCPGTADKQLFEREEGIRGAGLREPVGEGKEPHRQPNAWVIFVPAHHPMSCLTAVSPFRQPHDDLLRPWEVCSTALPAKRGWHLLFFTFQRSVLLWIQHRQSRSCLLMLTHSVFPISHRIRIGHLRTPSLDDQWLMLFSSSCTRTSPSLKLFIPWLDPEQPD